MKLPDFSASRILVVGDVMLDRYWTGPTGRISPEAPVPIVAIQNIEDRPGGAANVAMNAAALGANVTLIGLTGQDESAQILQQRLSSLGVVCDFCYTPGFDTITKLRVLSRNQQLIRLDFEKSFAGVDKTPMQERFAQQLKDADLVILSDYAKGALSDIQPLIQLAKQHNVPVIVDPKGSDFEKYAGATLLTPNMGEFETIVGECADETTLVSHANAMISRLDLQALLVTRSEKGMTLLQKDQDEVHLPAKAKEVYDVTGAGDTVISTLAVALASGCSLTDASALANAAASIVVGKLGTSTVSFTELSEAVGHVSQFGRGVMTQQQLAIAVESAKRRGEKVVMTNGCFDILHAGHVSYLQNASTLGDKLIVAVNSDQSVRALKGPGRPVNNVSRRMSVLAALASVYWVVEFDEDTPERLISEILPDILVKGGDYQIHQIAGGKQVIANGGDVKVLNFEDGVSTSSIIKNIVEGTDR
ncbi:bifunctional D-glycero-beta-D-manno-heptose-7-phosphate kinase/D-glycero-beta-D-manno-heptose 1-phosphate adenylyltransferase HldE [Aliiglaciecola sp. LCG003]|uniref:bifunctional D-glycero-beta-D-manno-heptose-7-phosphate kinase/D-glycero-beta-D-manno-heptose 1-phosphate adenylyltransferase HldE n=1 Tax=Aliiglaciecola sp. LCG003 TaxID=3053655 RepID=UPI0025723412|nr:bifunctional D-glycero-beta-D-manno-heptose-7-phosphate kinase/D-glycero-beta-D-manno-heptose 1-phosphate adenylyltransferase HldE [Aliiglaciecola sp. LCG003]WJG10436.1 bifunctional D-glycero-beta-D-manno-heptose-7-phosphate kinase/D-glycero-beta-D-manno-heptose 1-phosphate adenylyltransferase HldE [Aliiglaciecola sp. LCG003]